MTITGGAMKESKWVSDLHWVREGQQDRSRKTQAALLDAAEELFAKHGTGGATISGISSAAGCSIGAFYHHYSDKRAIQFALFERYATELAETNRRGLELNRWAGATIGDILLGYLELTMHNDRELPRRSRSAVALGQAESQIHDEMLRLRVQREVGLGELLLNRVDEIGHADPSLAVSFVLDQLGSMMRVRMHERGEPTGFGTQSDEEFIGEAIASVCAYLQVQIPSDS
jgi:AcrR family transcriptional regulator